MGEKPCRKSRRNSPRGRDGGRAWRRGQEAGTGRKAEPSRKPLWSLSVTKAARGPSLACRPGQGGSGPLHQELSPFWGYRSRRTKVWAALRAMMLWGQLLHVRSRALVPLRTEGAGAALRAPGIGLVPPRWPGGASVGTLSKGLWKGGLPTPRDRHPAPHSEGWPPGGSQPSSPAWW